MNLELYNTVYRGLDSQGYYTGQGKADLRLDSSGNNKIRAEVSLEFYPVDLSPKAAASTTPALNLKRAWIKARFPSWRLSLGKTRLSWGNGYVFNAGDIIFSSLGPFLDFTQSTIRDDTSWLSAANIPLGRFSYIEGVILAPKISTDPTSMEAKLVPWDKSSLGLRFFASVGGWVLEGGYLYKGDQMSAADLLGHRPYFSFHGHAGVDWYGGLSFAAGRDDSTGIYRDTWEEIRRSIHLSFGLYHQIQSSANSTLSFRFEGLLMPWQNWEAQANLLASPHNYYALMLYPEITWTLRATWFTSLQSIISPVDGSAQITSTLGWNIFQGFTLLSFAVIQAGSPQDLFAFDRSTGNPSDLDHGFNGFSFTVGARYRY